jgi:hypothetical protein
MRSSPEPRRSPEPGQRMSDVAPASCLRKRLNLTPRVLLRARVRRVPGAALIPRNLDRRHRSTCNHESNAGYSMPRPGPRFGG